MCVLNGNVYFMHLCVVLKIKKQKLKTKLHIAGGETQCVVPSGGK